MSVCPAICLFICIRNKKKYCIIILFVYLEIKSNNKILFKKSPTNSNILLLTANKCEII